jgi:hypothetical protein
MTEAPLPSLKHLTRLALIAFALVQLGLLAAGILLYPAYAAQHVHDFTPNAFWGLPETQAALVELNWPAITLPLAVASADLVVALVSISFGLFLLWRKSDDWFGLYLSFVFLALGGTTLIAPVLEWIPALTGPIDVLGGVGWQVLFITFYLFPDGRFVPRWTRWMLLAWLGVNLVQWIFAMDVLSMPELGLWVGMALVFTAVGSQVYRYIWRATPLERQQTKWVVAAIAALFVFIIVVGPPTFRAPPPDGLGPALQWALFFGLLFRVSFLVLPIAMLIAILRYRLWDIDVIIRRTLTYSALSAVLALAYFGIVLVLQGLFGALTGESRNELATVISTLAIAALFVPLRGRVQQAIDRRFFRQKYDAAKTLAAFAAAARDEVDLEHLSGQLVGVVQDTMQPAHASLWLRTSERRPQA